MNCGEVLVALIRFAIYPGERFDLGAVTAEHFFHRHADFPNTRACAGGFDCRFQNIAAVLGTAFKFVQRGVTGRLITGGADVFQTLDLAFAHGHVVHIKDVDRVFLILAVFVHANDHLVTAINQRLPHGRAFFDPQFGHPRGNRLGHAAHAIDLLDQLPCLFGQFMGQAFNVIGPCQRIDDIGDAGFLLQNQLRVARDAGAEIGRQGNRFVQRVGVQ